MCIEIANSGNDRWMMGESRMRMELDEGVKDIWNVMKRCWVVL